MTSQRRRRGPKSNEKNNELTDLIKNKIVFVGVFKQSEINRQYGYVIVPEYPNNPILVQGIANQSFSTIYLFFF